MGKVFRNAELERRVQERLFTRIASVHGVRIRRVLAGQYREAADRIEAGTGQGFTSGRLETAVAAVMRDGYQSVGVRADNAIREASGRGSKRAVAMSPEFEAALERYIRLHAGRKVTAVDAATKARIARIVEEGISEGYSYREVAVKVRDLALIDSAYRARVIALTESHGAANAGSLGSALASGVVKEKEWISAEDERTRDGTDGGFDHTGVANVPIDQPFRVSGEELMHPGDPAGSAGNIINCRCSIGYVV